MTGKITLTMIKPDAVMSGKTGAILSKILDGGFTIKAMKYMKLTLEQAQSFYSVHEGKVFYDGLVNFMSSGPLVAIMLEKDNAIDDFRKLIGATDPSKADEGTIRKLFAESMQRNAVHGSDSDENAKIETDFFFNAFERY